MKVICTKFVHVLCQNRKGTSDAQDSQRLCRKEGEDETAKASAKDNFDSAP